MEVSFRELFGENDVGIKAKFFMSCSESSINLTGKFKGGDKFIVIERDVLYDEPT
jgi:hypothetical protein